MATINPLRFVESLKNRIKTMKNYRSAENRFYLDEGHNELEVLNAQISLLEDIVSSVEEATDTDNT